MGLSILSDSQKQAPGSITNKNFKEIEICDGWCPLFKTLDYIFYVGEIILYIVSGAWILDLVCYLITFSWWTNTCNFPIYNYLGVKF